MIKMKKALLALLMTSILTATLIIGLSTEVKAETKTRYFGLYNNGNTRPTNVSVTTQCVTGTNPNKPVIKIYEHDSSAAGSPTKNTTVYCLRAGAGFGSEATYTGNTITAYNYYHNLKDLDGIEEAYKSTLPTGDLYKELVWSIDNFIDPRDNDYSDDDAILQEAGTSRAAFTNNGSMSDEQYCNMIESIQQAIIWYYTNRTANDQFTQTCVTDSDKVQALIVGLKYNNTSFMNVYGMNQVIAANTPAGKLATYYFNQAVENKENALDSNSSTATFDKSRAQMQIVGDYYFVGPYKYNGVNASSVTITVPSSAPYALVKAANASAAELTGANDTAKVNGAKNTDFYIRVPVKYNNKTVSGSISINVKASYSNKVLTYYNVAGAVANNQPLVIIENENKTLDETDTKNLENPEFDLAIRKYITEIKDANGTVKYNASALANRVPDIATPPAFNLDEGTTARKSHSKNALQVENGDVVTYRIVVYNEGTLAATDVQVTDYLPDGLQYQSGSKTWTAGTKTGDFTPYTLTYGTVDAYDEGTVLPSSSNTITCKVTATAGTSRINLKNITEITSASNSKNLNDRDSNPGNLTPSTGYAPTTAPQGKGEQDDDDYEHLYVEPNREFDLAIRKYITQIKASDGTVKYNASALSNRVPNIATPPAFELDNGTTAKKTHSKTPLKVENGDVITYTITVYNEGDIAATDVQVTDYLPDGLQYQSGSKTWGQQTKVGDYTPYTLNYGTIDAASANSLKAVSNTITCKVTATEGTNRVDLKNQAAITSATGGQDRDSSTTGFTPSPSYNPQTAEQGKGEEDDDDFEHLYIEANAKIDLAIRKYITEIKAADGTVKYNASALSNRVPNIATPPAFELDADNTTAKKTHSKEAVKVEQGDVITYTITVYNESNVAASNVQVTDYLPTGLAYKSGNKTWTAGTKVGDYTPYTLTYGSVNAYNGGNNLTEVSNTITCEVVEAPGANRKDLKNITEITNAEGGTDRDSQPKSLTPNDSYNPDTAEQGKGVQDDDDYEHLYIEPLKEFDLAIRKYIAEVKSANGTVKYSSSDLSNRVPNISTPPTFNLDTNNTTATKAHSKAALKVEKGDIITYAITVYNEGEVNATNVSVTDYLPTGLTYKSGEWTPGTASGKYTPYTISFGNIPAYDKQNTLPSVTKQITCEVTASTTDGKVDLKNITEVTSSEGGTDRDSQPKNVTPGDDYNPENPEQGKGVQDDDDFEHVVVEPAGFDLALKKFIGKLNTTELKTDGKYDREPSVETKNRDGVNVKSFTYNFKNDKTPIKVQNNDVITYIIRVYNEGGANGYANKIKDDIPTGLVFLPTNATNTKNGWYMLDSTGKKTTDVNKAVSVETDAFGYGKNKARLLKAFDPNTMENNPDYFDVEVAFKVAQPAKENKERVVINSAEISENGDSEGKPTNDIDSDEDNMKPGEPKEDDEDIEKIYVKYFDLSLKKWTTEAIVTEDGNTIVKKTGHSPEDNPEQLVKVEVNQKRIESTVIKFKYSIRVKNEGEIDGAATEISEYVPDGLKFDPKDNPDWKQANGKVTTTKLKDVILKPGEYADVEIILTWVNSPDNVKAMNNVAEISKDYNESGTPDIDSTPDNKKPDEDDYDDAPVIVTMVTGSAPKYLALTTGFLSIVVAGAALLKKYVLS